jgi:preprotein translocase subunit SecE
VNARRPTAVRPTPPRAPTARRGAPAQPQWARIPLVRDIVEELRKVTWPTREETIRLTILVIVVSVAIGVMLGLVDLFFAALMNRLLRGG